MPATRTATSDPASVTRDTNTSSRRSPLDRLRKHVDGRDVDPSAWPVAAARREIDESDLVHFAQVRLLDDRALRDDGVDVEAQPADVGERELALQPVDRRSVGVIADEPRAVGELDDRPDHMESRRLRHPADARE